MHKIWRLEAKMDSLNFVIRSGVLIFLYLIQATKNSCCSNKSELHQELRRWIYCMRGMQDMKTRIETVCLLLRTRVVGGNGAEEAQKTKALKLECKAFAIFSVDGLQKNKSCIGILVFISFLSDGCQGVFLPPAQFLCCLHTWGNLVSCYLQMEVADKDCVSMCT